jgi:glycerol-3-phosphate acyltransferase PlsY
VLELGFKVFIAYIAGSLNGALFVGALYGGIDIRKVGSGNAGGTNALRTQGKLFAVLVLLVDIGKGVLPVLLLPGLDLPGIGLDPEISREWLAYACGGAAIFGHCYPVWFQFVGGKGAATTLGVLAAVAPLTLLPAALIWFGTLYIFGYVGLATVLSAVAIPVFVILTDWPDQPGLFLFSSLIALFVMYTHRSNIRKLTQGQGKPDISFSLMHRTG